MDGWMMIATVSRRNGVVVVVVVVSSSISQVRSVSVRGDVMVVDPGCCCLLRFVSPIHGKMGTLVVGGGGSAAFDLSVLGS